MESPSIESHPARGSRLIVAAFSVVVGVSLFLMKIWAYNLTKSSAVYSDAMESIVNVLASAFLVFTVIYAAKPADADHPYGHGKMEFVSAVFEGGLIGFAGIMIAYEAVVAWIQNTPLGELGHGLWVVGLAGGVNCIMGLVLINHGRKTKSEALVADGKHLISDFLTSLGVLVGLFLVQWTGFQWIDKIVALLMSALLLFTSIRLVALSLGGLLDKQSLPTLNQLVTAFNRHRAPWIIHVHHLRVIRSGDLIHVDAHLSMPEFWDLAKCHEHMEKLEELLRKDLGQPVDFHFHLDPCMRGYCTQCSLEPCPIRKQPFKKLEDFTLQRFLLKDEDIKAYHQNRNKASKPI